MEGWLGDLVKERDGQRKVREDQLDREKSALATLDRQRDERMAELEEVGITKIGMELIERMDAKREAQAQRIAEAEAVLAEWTPPAGVDKALDVYSRLRDSLQGRTAKANGAAQLHDALAGVLAGLWCEIRPWEFGNDRLHVEFELREQPDVFLPADPVLPGERPDRDWLPPVELPRSKPGPKPYSS